MSDKYPTSTMTDSAIRHDEELGVPLYNINKIFSDHDFNCRDNAANPIDSVELARSIVDNGLICPIVIRKCGEQPGDPTDEFDYVIVAGYRRYQAYRVNNHPVIPAVLSSGRDHKENVIVNLIENLKRKNLSILEEAKAIRPFYESHWSRDEIAEKLGMSTGWVQVRCMLLELDPTVQAEFAGGILLGTHIRQLYRYKDNSDKQMELAAAIKGARQGGDKRASTIERIVDKDQKPKATSKKRRTVKEIEDMMEYLEEIFNERGLIVRALAWSAGHVANYEFYQDIRSTCLDQNIPCRVPDFDL